MSFIIYHFDVIFSCKWGLHWSTNAKWLKRLLIVVCRELHFSIFVSQNKALIALTTTIETSSENFIVKSISTYCCWLFSTYSILKWSCCQKIAKFNYGLFSDNGLENNMSSRLWKALEMCSWNLFTKMVIFEAPTNRRLFHFYK